MASRPVGRPRAHTRDAVLDAALDIIDARGLDALSIRSLAVALGVTPGTIYSYVESKDDLLRGVMDRLVAAIPVADGEPEPTWSAELGALLRAYYTLLASHPKLLTPDTVVRGAVPAGARFGERVLQLLEAGECDGDPLTVLSMLSSYVTGAAFSTAWSRSAGAVDTASYRSFPRVHALLDRYRPDDADRVFEAGLAFLLDAVAAGARGPGTGGTAAGSPAPHRRPPPTSRPPGTGRTAR